MKIDLKTTVPTYRAAHGRFDVVTVAPAQFLMIDGAGDPNTSAAYREALETLYPVAYAVKFAAKAAGDDFVVPPLEARWWAEDMASFTAARDKSQWSWTAMLAMPAFVTAADVDAARAKVAAKGGGPALDRLRFEELDEGLCVQTLHLGPFDDEGPVLAKMHDEVIPAQGLRMTGRHHEIYFADARRVAPEKFRTILRQPVERV